MMKSLFVALIGVVLTACGGSDGAGQEPSAESSQAPLVSSPKLGVVPPPRQAGVAAPLVVSGPPTYFGGAVLQPEIVSLYWGTFAASDISTMQTYLGNLAKHLSGDTASAGGQPVTYEYGVVGARVGATYTDSSLPTGSIQESDVSAKIGALQQAGHLPAYSPERVIMVFTNGITYSDGYGSNWCAYHSDAGSNQFFGVIPMNTQPGWCDAGGAGGFTAAQVWQAITSHEVMEAATDPAGGSWLDPGADCGNTSGWCEIGDPCAWDIVAMPFGGIQDVVDGIHLSCAVWVNELMPPISATSSAASKFDAYALGGDQTMYHKALSGTTWTPAQSAAWEQLGTQKFSGQPVTTHWGTQEHIFATGVDGNVYHKSVTGTTWTPSKTTWEKLGGVIYGPVAAVALGTNQVEVYGMGTTGGYFHKSLTASGWLPSTTSWDTVSAGSVWNSPPAVATTGSGGVIVVGAGPDGLYYAGSPPNFLWTYLPSAIYPGPHYIGAPVVTNRTATEYDIIGIGSDLAVNHTHCIGPNVDNGACANTESLGGQFVGIPAAVSWGTSRLDVTGEVASGSLSHRTWTTSGWGSWLSLPGTFNSGPSLVSWGASRIDLFVRGALDPTAYHRSQTNNTWSPSSSFESIGGSIH
jgi:Repeat of unknown function (DUF346)